MGYHVALIAYFILVQIQTKLKFMDQHPFTGRIIVRSKSLSPLNMKVSFIKLDKYSCPSPIQSISLIENISNARILISIKNKVYSQILNFLHLFIFYQDIDC